MPRKYLTVAEIRKLLESLPSYYDNMPVTLVDDNVRYPITQAKANETLIGGMVYGNSLDFYGECLIKQREEEKRKKEEARKKGRREAA